jgi:hypothetical protein
MIKKIKDYNIIYCIMKSIFSNLPNNLIMEIIKINTEQKKDDYWRWRFSSCMYELQYEWNCLETEYFNED